MMRPGARALTRTLGRPRRRPSRRPALERLEARTVLSTLFVDVNDPTASDPGDNLYAQIQEAVDATSPGDTIRVNPGTYQPFTVAVNDLTIKGADDGASPVVDATGSQTGVMIQADGVTMQGLTVENAGAFGVVVNGSHNTLRNNVASNSGFFGFGVISVGGPPAGSFVGNTLIGNTASGGREGFVLGLNTGSTLTGNVARDNLGFGFDISSCTDTTLVGNLATGSGSVGIAVFDGSGNRLIGNSALDGGLLGFQIGGTDGTITGNTASGNASTGFNIFRAQDNTYTGNVAQDNGGTGFVLYGSSGNTLRGNVSDGNAGSGFSLVPYVFTRVSIVSFPARTARLTVTGIESSDDNTLQGNEATGNGEDGFFLRCANGNTLRGNVADANAGDGFRVEQFHFVVPPRFGIFTLLNAGETIATAPTQGNVLQGNEADGNGGYGYYSDVAMVNTFKGNRAKKNMLGGFNF